MEQKAFELIDQLAAKMGVASEFIFAILVKQAYINSIILVIIDVIFIIISAVIWRRRYKISAFLHDEDGYLEAGTTMIFMVVGSLYCVIFMVLFVGVFDLITGFLNPEYWAIEQILDIVK